MLDLQTIPVGATRTYRRASETLRVTRESESVVSYEYRKDFGKLGSDQEGGVTSIEALAEDVGDGWEVQVTRTPAVLQEVNGK